MLKENYSNKKRIEENALQSLNMSLSEKISNTLLQTLDALSALYQLITGKFSF